MIKEKLNKIEDDVSHRRGKVISSFALIEDMVMNFVTFHYSDRHFNQLFKLEVLCDSSFNFALLQRIFFKILKKHYPDIFDTFPKNYLNNLCEYRNIIAHSPSLFQSSYSKNNPDVDFELIFSRNGDYKSGEEIIRKYWVSYKIVEHALNFILFHTFDYGTDPDKKTSPPLFRG